MKFNKKLLPFIALIAATSIWGANNSVMKITLHTVPLFILAFIRFAAAALILLPFVFKKLAIKKRDISPLIISALLGVSLNISFFFFSLKLTTALNAGIIVASSPIFTLLAAHVLLKENIARKLVFGAVLGFLGILIIIAKDFQGGISFSPVGDLFVLLATLAFVGYDIVSKGLFKTYSSLTVSFYSFAIGAFTFMPLAYLEYLRSPFWIDKLTTSSYLGIGYGIFLASLSAYTLWQWGLSKVNVSRVGFFFYLDPIVSTVVAVFLLSEAITLPFAIGALMIFAGIFIAEGHLPYHHVHKAIRS